MSCGPRVAIGLGSSLGDRRQRLEATVQTIARWPDVTALRCSRWYRTPPMQGGAARNWFLNGALLVRTSLDPALLLDRCRELEGRAGRRRASHWGDRTLDIDLLLVEGLVRRTPALMLPHPGLADRAFVRAPLLDIWPDAVDPRSGRPLRELPPPTPPRAWPIGQPASALLLPRASR